MKAQLRLSIEDAGLPRWITRHHETQELVAASIYNNSIDKAAEPTDTEIKYLQDQVLQSNYELILFDNQETSQEVLLTA